MPAETSTIIDPETEVSNTCYDAFESSDYEARISLVNRTLEEGMLMDGELAFEMLNMLYPQVVKRSEWERFDGLVASLQERLPNVYEEEAHYLLDWGINNALAAGREEDLKIRTIELAGFPALPPLYRQHTAPATIT